MFKLAAEKGIKSWVQTVPISADNLSKTLVRLHENSGEVRYRYTMVDYDKEFDS
jgi:alcohol dehydrogenase (NADP+)